MPIPFPFICVGHVDGPQLHADPVGSERQAGPAAQISAQRWSCRRTQLRWGKNNKHIYSLHENIISYEINVDLKFIQKQMYLTGCGNDP